MIYQNKKDFIEKNISKQDSVLDIGFWGQGVSVQDPNWVHTILKNNAHDVVAIDLEFDTEQFKEPEYVKASAEDFKLNTTFDVVFAGDLIEHLSNPGMFLQSSKKHLKDGGRIIISTPNCFNLFNITEKLTKEEPTVNIDHTCYFNKKTLKQLAEKNGLTLKSVDFIYSLGVHHKESFKKRFLNVIYYILSRFSEKFIETIVVTLVLKK